ncbi:copper chaperone PCu(A)C [Segnochrobactraceae bacterium EtOH-i3]
MSILASFRRPGTLIATAAVGALLAFGAAAHGYKVGAIEISHPWTRATPPAAKVAGGFMKITNTGTTDDVLISGSAPEIAGRVEIHEMAVTDGIMTMRPLKDGLPIKAGETVELKPGSFHIMFMELKKPLVEGEKIPGSVTFRNAGTVNVEFAVDKMAARTPDMQGHQMPDGDAHSGH